MRTRYLERFLRRPLNERNEICRMIRRFNKTISRDTNMSFYHKVDLSSNPTIGPALGIQN